MSLGANPYQGDLSDAAERKKAKSYRTDDVFEILDQSENPTHDAKLLMQKVRALILQQQVISIEDKGHIIHMLHDQRMRAILTDLLAEVTGPKRIENIEVLRITADIMRFVLTLFVHDEFSDPKLFGAILESASHIYY